VPEVSGGESIRDYSPDSISTDGFIDDIDIVGSKMEFDFTGIPEECTVVFAIMGSNVECAKCLKVLPECLMLKTTIGDILACRECNEFVRVIEEEE